MEKKIIYKTVFLFRFVSQTWIYSKFPKLYYKLKCFFFLTNNLITRNWSKNNLINM